MYSNTLATYVAGETMKRSHFEANMKEWVFKLLGGITSQNNLFETANLDWHKYSMCSVLRWIEFTSLLGSEIWDSPIPGT